MRLAEERQSTINKNKSKYQSRVQLRNGEKVMMTMIFNNALKLVLIGFILKRAYRAIVPVASCEEKITKIAMESYAEAYLQPYAVS